MRLCGFEAGIDHPLFLIAGPCVIESAQLTIDIAGTLKEICSDLSIPFIFKASFDKANRSSNTSFVAGFRRWFKGVVGCQGTDRCAGFNRCA